MPKPVAVDGDTQVETSTSKFQADSNQTGSWQLVTSSVMKGQKLSVDGKLVELSATAAWQYVGGTTGSPPSGPIPIPPIPDSATLMAGSSKLTDGGQGLLVDGDEATGSVDGGNKITGSSHLPGTCVNLNSGPTPGTTFSFFISSTRNSSIRSRVDTKFRHVWNSVVGYCILCSVFA